MNSRTTRFLTCGLLTCLVLVSGCGGSPETPGATAAPEPSTSSNPADPCATLELTAGAELSGPELGDCVVDSVLAAGSGRMASHYEGWSDLLDAEGEFTTTPEFSVSVSFYGGAAGAVVIGDQGWVDDTMGWVAADPAGDLRQINAAQVTSLLRTTADPQANADFIAMFETWDVTGPVDVTLPDGSVITGTGVAARGEQTLDGTRVSGSTFVLDEALRPIASRAGSSQAGTTVFTNLTYYDWGTPIAVDAPL